MRIPRPAAEKLGVDRQDPDLDGLLLGLIRRATGGCHEHAARLDPMYGIGEGRGLIANRFKNNTEITLSDKNTWGIYVILR